MLPREIVEEIRQRKLAYTDQARDFQPVEWRLKAEGAMDEAGVLEAIAAMIRREVGPQ